MAIAFGDRHAEMSVIACGSKPIRSVHMPMQINTPGVMINAGT